MPYSVGDPGHVKAHSDLVSTINVELARFGLTGALPIKDEGAEGHLDDHNAIRAKLDELATIAGQSFSTPLPPVRSLGDGSHTDDHNILAECASEVAGWAAWNDATGGTVTTYNVGGDTWRQHLFLSSGTFTVRRNVHRWHVVLVAGGGAGGAPFGGQPGWCGAGSGGWTIPAVSGSTLSGAVSITVGSGGTGYNKGADSTIAGLGTVGGGGCGWRGDGWSNEKTGRPGTWGSISTGGTATANTNNFTPWPSSGIKAPNGSAPHGGLAGRGGAAGYDDHSNRPGMGGFVAIAYQVGAASRAVQSQVHGVRVRDGVVIDIELGDTEWLRAAQGTKNDDGSALIEYSDNAPAYVGYGYDPARGFEQPPRMVLTDDDPPEIVTDENGAPSYYPSEWQQAKGVSDE